MQAIALISFYDIAYYTHLYESFSHDEIYYTTCYCFVNIYIYRTLLHVQTHEAKQIPAHSVPSRLGGHIEI